MEGGLEVLEVGFVEGIVDDEDDRGGEAGMGIGNGDETGAAVGGLDEIDQWECEFREVKELVFGGRDVFAFGSVEVSANDALPLAGAEEDVAVEVGVGPAVLAAVRVPLDCLGTVEEFVSRGDEGTETEAGYVHEFLLFEYLTCRK